MTNRIYTTAFTVTAGTAIASPLSQAVVLDDVKLDSVRIIITPGHAALTGLAIFWGGTQVAPYGLATWITGDDEIIDYPFDGEITAHGLQLRGYNTDIFDHTFRLRWLVSDIYKGGPVVSTGPQFSASAGAADTSGLAGLSSDTTGAGDQLVPTDQQSGVLTPDLSGGVS